MRSRISQIKDTINQIITNDSSLAERERTLFHEKGVTIHSVLTAIGLAISTLVLALSGRSSKAPSTPTPAEPSSKGGAKEWFKSKLASLGRMLAWVGKKALSALPGIIGNLVSWIFEKASAVV